MSDLNIKGQPKAVKKGGSVARVDGGKLPPQAIDLEEAVLGALMLEKNPVNDVIDILKPENFYKEPHQKIYGAIVDLFGASEPIDILTVTSTVAGKGELDDLVGGPYYISQLTNKVASTACDPRRIIAQKYIMRELIRISGETIQNAYDETTDVFDLLDRAESELYGVAEGIQKELYSMSQIMKQAIDQIRQAQNQRMNQWN